MESLLEKLEQRKPPAKQRKRQIGIRNAATTKDESKTELSIPIVNKLNTSQIDRQSIMSKLMSVSKAPTRQTMTSTQQN